jgi:protocatechuate 3,4-dioxygenase beta subunit
MSRVPRTSAVVLAFVACAVVTAPQASPQTPAASAVIAGIVTSDDQLAQPVRRVIVTLSGTGMAASVQRVTDDGGRFAFEGLPAGRYTLTAEKPAYIKTFHGSRRPGRGPAMPLALADGQRLTDLAIRLARGAVIAGTVFDSNGNPLASGQVSALQAVVVNGERKLIDPVAGTRLATTDDRGRYRIFGLLPGEYTVRASGSSGWTGDVRLTTAEELDQAARELRGGVTSPAAVPATVERRVPPIRQIGGYFPGVSDAALAEFFTLDAGDERTGVNIRMQLARAVRVDGTSIGPDGQPLQNVMIGIANASTGSLWTSPGGIRPGPDGRFTLPGMTAARWVLFGRGAAGTGKTEEYPLWAETEFTVAEQDVSGVVLRFARGAVVSGRVALRGQAAPPSPSALQISLVPLPVIEGTASATPSVPPQADGSFRIPDVAPGRYRVRVLGTGSWSLRSAMLSDRDTLDLPLEIRAGEDVGNLVVTLIDRPTEVTGTLFDQLGRPAPEFSVVVFSTDRAHWATVPRRVSGVVRLASDGRFSVTGLPPGEYYLGVLTDADASQLTDLAFLEQLATTAIRITLAEGERKVQDVKMAGG